MGEPTRGNRFSTGTLRNDRRPQGKPSKRSGGPPLAGKKTNSVGNRRNNFHRPEKRTPGTEGAYLSINQHMPMAQYHTSKIETNDRQDDN